MGDAIGQALAGAVGIAISPFPIVGVVLMLGSERGRSNGYAFLAGWLAGLVGAGALLLLLAGVASASDDGAPALWVNWLKVLLGAGLVVVALRQWLGRPRGGAEPATPTWMGAVGAFTPAKAAGLGVVLAAVNPKNLLLVFSGTAAIAQTGIAAEEQALALLVFTVVASIGVTVPLVIDLAMGDRAAELLGRLETWMADNNAVIMAAILLVIGAKLIGDAISGLF